MNVSHLYISGKNNFGWWNVRIDANCTGLGVVSFEGLQRWQVNLAPIWKNCFQYIIKCSFCEVVK